MRIITTLILAILIGSTLTLHGEGANLPFPYGNGSIDQLLDLFDETECQRDFLGFCKRGTIVIDPWTDYALATQRDLVRDLPVDQILFIGTHNSFNNRADGYGFGDLVINGLIRRMDSHSRFIWAQQEYTITDQLNMGIRELHLDPHWYGSWLPGASDQLRLCHGAGNVTFVNRIIGDIESALNITIYFDSEQLGCSPLDRLYYDGLLEIRQWQLNNPEEFLFIHQDDSEGATYNNTQTTIQMIQDVFGETIFTPIDFSGMFNSTWPSIRELVSNNKTIMWQSENDYGAGDGTIIFKPLLCPLWPNNCAKYFSASPITPWSTYQGESQIVGNLYDGSQACGLLIPDNIPLLLNYNISVLELDQVSPALMKSFVWTWAMYEPTGGCPYWNSSDGRWYTDDYSSTYPYLCRQDTQLVVSAPQGPWGNSSCPLGSIFSVLRSKYESNMLMSQLGNNKRIWMNYVLD